MTNMDQPHGSGFGGTGIDVANPPTGSTNTTTSSSGTKDQAKEAASTAAAEGKHVTAVAGDEAQKVAAEAKLQTQKLLDDARGQLEEQSRTQRDRLVGTLGSLGNDLDRMSGHADSGLASDLVQQAAQRVKDLQSRIDGREPKELLGEVRDFARRKPGTFLLGALAVGVVAGRMARGAQKAQQSSTSSPSSTSGTSGLPAQTPPSAQGYGAGLESGLGAGLDTGTETQALPATPSAPAMATFPPDQPGEFR